jgi:sRNA-binding protein
MSKAARRARIAAVIELLCDRFPQTFSLYEPRPLKVGVHAEVMAALGDAIQPRDLQSALRAYTGTTRYRCSLSAGAPRIGLDGRTAGFVASEDEAFAKKRLAELAKGPARQTNVAPAGQVAPEESPMRPAAENERPTAAKRLSLSDLREAGRRRRGAAAF